MIRNRMGLVTMGAGGNAGSYSFDPSTGLSNDPQLAYYLQNLTPAQLQTALNGESPGSDLSSLLYQDLTATGAGSLPCGGADNPTCGPPASTPLSTILLWGAGILGVVLLLGGRR